MPNNENLSLVPLPGSALAKQSPGAERVLSPMVVETLALIPRTQTSLQIPRFRIGEHELCGPDYQQVLQWVEELKLPAADFLDRLFDAKRLNVGIESGHLPKWLGTRIEDGRFASINWDLGLLPSSHFKLSRVLCFTALSFSSPTDGMVSFAELDLSPMPNLTNLDCGGTRITKLDLSPVPNLTVLGCTGRAITELDLSPVQELTVLDCSYCSGLTELDLSPVPNLTKLGCSFCKGLAELDLSCVPELTALNCSMTQISELSLSHVPKLTSLDCFARGITNLDIRPLSQLKKLSYHKGRVRLIQRPDQNF